MQKVTYLQECLNKGRISRWQESAMPLPIFVAPFNWYSKRSESEVYKYKQMVISALNLWEKMSGGVVSFNVVSNLNDSLINLEWKRVDRKSLGQCHFNFDQFGRFYSAEVQIGISDGILHREYMDENEVFHTICHEIGHAVGLGHSQDKSDIMYTPHQYGMIKPSKRDINTLKWLYKFGIGKTFEEIKASYPNERGRDLDELIYYLALKKSKFQEELESQEMSSSRNLLDENKNIGDIKKYLLEINNLKINLNDNYKKM